MVSQDDEAIFLIGCQPNQLLWRTRVACAYQPHAHSVHQNQSLLLVQKMHTSEPYSLSLIEAISFFAVSQKR
jgi:hypothetical protein